MKMWFGTDIESNEENMADKTVQSSRRKDKRSTLGKWKEKELNEERGNVKQCSKEKNGNVKEKAKSEGKKEN